jgi:hypothetical protein
VFASISGVVAVVRRLAQHSIVRRIAVAGLLCLPVFFTGCALFNADRWNLDRYRDERAVDIEENLARKKPIVADPF